MGYWQKRSEAFINASRGVLTFYRETAHAKIHLLAALMAIGLGFYCHISPQEWMVLSLSISFVLALEALNSALEYLVDLYTQEYHPLAKKAKDVAAAAVLIASLGAAAVGGILFIPKLFL